MKIDRRGREFANWTVTSDDVLTGMSFEVSFDNVIWSPLTRTNSTISVLVAGPDATSNPVGTVVLPVGSYKPRIRVTDNPEIVIRPTGTITIY